jgi:hypothetical protein
MNTSSDVDCLNVSVSCTMTSCRKQGKALKVRIHEQYFCCENIKMFNLKNFFQTENLCRPITFYKIFFLREMFLGGNGSLVFNRYFTELNKS